LGAIGIDLLKVTLCKFSRLVVEKA